MTPQKVNDQNKQQKNQRGKKNKKKVKKYDLSISENDIKEKEITK